MQSHSMANSMWVMWQFFPWWLHCIWSPIESEWEEVCLSTSIEGPLNRAWVTATFVLPLNATSPYLMTHREWVYLHFYFIQSHIYWILWPTGSECTCIFFLQSVHDHIPGHQPVSVHVVLLFITSNSMANRLWVTLTFSAMQSHYIQTTWSIASE